MDKKSDFMANLMRAKQTMDKVESTNFKIDTDRVHQMVSGGDVQYLNTIPEGATPHSNNITRPVGNVTPEQINASKLPDAVKKIMIEKPIPKVEMASGGGPTFSMEDVHKLVRPQLAKPVQQQPTTFSQVPNMINETTIVNSQGKMLITMTEAELDKKINDALMNFMATTFTKQLKEETIKKTISTLIKEGKIRVKQKTTK